MPGPGGHGHGGPHGPMGGHGRGPGGPHHGPPPPHHHHHHGWGGWGYYRRPYRSGCLGGFLALILGCGTLFTFMVFVIAHIF